MVLQCSPGWPRICGDPPVSACLHTCLQYVLTVDPCMYQKFILLKTNIYVCVFPPPFKNIVHGVHVCASGRHSTMFRSDFSPPTCWVPRLAGQTPWPLNLLEALRDFWLLLSVLVDRDCFLLWQCGQCWELPQSVWLLFSDPFPCAEELLYHSGTPGVPLESPLGCVLPRSFLEPSTQ